MSADRIKKRTERGPLVPGVRFGKLVTVESAGRDDAKRSRWVFQCDCGNRVTWNVCTVDHNVRKLGWCSCPDCYRAAGGWNAIADSVSRGTK